MPVPQIVLPDAPTLGGIDDPKQKGKVAPWFISWFKQLSTQASFFPCDTTAGNLAFVLPTGAIYMNQERTYLKTSADGHTVTITGAQGGAVVLNTQFSKQRFRYDGKNWWPV